jgi:uncharacterized membrane protein
MAGIGFELRKHLRKDTYLGFLAAYLLAGIVGSGPWVISIGSMVVIGLLGSLFGTGDGGVASFLATVTQLIAWSLIASGLLQHLFTRFVADRTFEGRSEVVLPNLLGALSVTSIVAAVLAGAVALFAFPAGHGPFRILLVTAFVVLCDVWILTVVLSGMKGYRSLLVAFGAGYATTVLFAIGLARFGAAGALAGFVVGQAAMLFGMLVLVAREFPSPRVVAFEFLERRKIHPELAIAGFAFNLGVWADKIVFWVAPATSESVIGPIRVSVVYDVPISLAYLSVVPGMAAFLVRIETDFADAFATFFGAVREGAPLRDLRRMRADLVAMAREGIHDVFRIQGLATAGLLLAAPAVLAAFRIPQFYLHLFRIDLVAAGFQVVLLSTLTILFYFDYRKLVVLLCLLFVASNLGLSALTLWLGPRFYGLGFVLAGAGTSLVAMAALSRKLERLEYETFMR